MTQSRHDARGRSEDAQLNAKRPRVMMSPFINTTNRYIEIQKDLYRAAGYDVIPLSIKGLLKGGIAELFKPKNILVFHWLEYRPFKREKGAARLSLTGSVLFVFYSAVILIARAKAVSFVHDHAVHDSSGFNRRLSIGLGALVRRLTAARVVHAPDFQGVYDASYLPHPLYWDAPGQPPTTPKPERARPLFAMLGVIRPYKQIDEVLNVWPADSKLYIAGRATPPYLAKLNRTIDKRSLHDAVQLNDKFLSDAEFAQSIADSDVLILPHAADSMLVSGAFFEAIGRVPLLIARSTPFMAWAARKFDNVRLFDDVAEIPAIVSEITQSWPEVARNASSGVALDEFGWNACCRRYQAFLETVAGRESAAEGVASGDVVK